MKLNFKKMFEGILYEKPLAPLPETPMSTVQPKPLTFKAVQSSESIDETFDDLTEDVQNEPIILDPKVERDGYLVMLQNAPEHEKTKVFATIPNTFYSDPIVMYEAAKHIPGILSAADESLLDDERFMRRVVELDPKNLRFASDPVRRTLEEYRALMSGIIQAQKLLNMQSPVM